MAQDRSGTGEARGTRSAHSESTTSAGDPFEMPSISPRPPRRALRSQALPTRRAAGTGTGRTAQRERAPAALANHRRPASSTSLRPTRKTTMTWHKIARARGKSEELEAPDPNPRHRPASPSRCRRSPRDRPATDPRGAQVSGSADNARRCRNRKDRPKRASAGGRGEISPPGILDEPATGPKNNDDLAQDRSCTGEERGPRNAHPNPRHRPASPSRCRRAPASTDPRGAQVSGSADNASRCRNRKDRSKRTSAGGIGGASPPGYLANPRPTRKTAMT